MGVTVLGVAAIGTSWYLEWGPFAPPLPSLGDAQNIPCNVVDLNGEAREDMLCEMEGHVPSVGLDFIKRSEELGSCGDGVSGDKATCEDAGATWTGGRIRSRPDTEFVYSRHPITVKGKTETRTCELQLDMLPKSSWWRWNEEDRFRTHKNMRCGSDAEWKEHLPSPTREPQTEDRFYPSKAETKAVLDKHLKLD